MRAPTLTLLGFLLVPVVGLSALSKIPPRPASLPTTDADRRLKWVAELPAPAPAWPDQDRLPFDRAPHPLLVGARVYHGDTPTNCVVARARETGAEVWRFVTGGPVRLPLSHWRDLIFAVSDDGFLYALEAETGTVRWKMRGSPTDRKLLGNERLISAWPARGGPVVAVEKDDRATVYFAAGIWPFMGIFLHALDAETGTVHWTCDGEGARYMKQPHNADSFGGVAPQGSLVVAGDLLLVPGGRSVPAVFNRHTGEPVHFRLADFGKSGSSEVQASGDIYTCGDAAFATATGTYLGRLGDPCLVADDRLYAWDRGQLAEYDIAGVPLLREDGKVARLQSPGRLTWEPRPLQTVALRAPLALTRHGNRLFVALADKVIALPLPLPRGKLAPVWEALIPGTPVTLTADDNDLVVATRQGSLLCYGFTPEQEPTRHPLKTERPVENPADVQRANALLNATGQREGYALIWGDPAAGVARELVRQSRLRVVLAVANPDRAEELRTQSHKAGLYGDRLTILAGTPETLDLPPYFASLVLLDDPTLFDDALKTGRLERVFTCVRPHGGALVGPAGRGDALKQPTQPTLPVRDVSGVTFLVRAGALPGAGNWTHEHGDAAGTRVSRDTIVKAPLGLLWFGGPSSEGVLPRHGHGPQPQVIDGRVIIEGVDLLRALDIYTGRLLWETKLPGVGKMYDNTAHQPGANASGGNFVSLTDAIYVAVGKQCVRLDPGTGKEVARFNLPSFPGAGVTAVWSYLNVTGDYLIGGSQPDNPSSRTARVAPSASKLLFVMNRKTGKLLWSATARLDGWRHNAICAGAGKLFAIERPTTPLLWGGKESDKVKGTPRLVAFDLASGNESWSSLNDIFGTWLSYSEDQGVLVEAGRVARDGLLDEPKGMRAYQASTGRVLWTNPDYAGPTMLHGDTILFGANSGGKMCSLLTGERVLRPDPVTGALTEWTWARHYGCNTPMASEHLITFRSGAAGFYDLCNGGGTGNLGGFRSGCTNNLVVAGGLLVVPDYTRTCTCSYQNQCSIALVPMPNADLWTFQGGDSAIKGVVRRLGVLLGAPGNRKADSGTLWLEYPSSGSPGPKPDVSIAGPEVTYYRRHFTQIEGTPAWAGASGAIGLERLTLTLGPKGTPPRHCTVRLVFAEPDAQKTDERIFSVALNGQTVLPSLNIRAEAGAPLKVIVKEFTGIEVADKLEVKLTAISGVPVLSGVEVVQE
jgi:outer membrane protein assembly factor BamB